MSTKQIAEALGYDPNYIRRLRRKLGVGTPDARYEPHSSDVWDKALFLLKDGASYRDVAETTGIPRATLSRNLPGYGWTSEQGGAHGYALVNADDELREALIRKKPVR